MSINLSKNNIKNIKMSDKYYAYIKLMVILFFIQIVFFLNRFWDLILYDYEKYVFIAILSISFIYFKVTSKIDKMLYNTMIYSVCVIFLIVFGLLFSYLKLESIYSSFNADNIEYLYINYKDIFNKWNKISTGNDVNSTLSGGKLLVLNDKIISGIDVKNNIEYVCIDGASYLNKYDHNIVYRNDYDRKIYSYNLEDNKKEIVYEGNCGEVFCDSLGIYFIDYGNNAHVVYMNKEKVISDITDEAVSSFVICGKYILYLNTNHNLLVKNIYTNDTKIIADNVERFFMNGNIIIERKNKIISINPTGNKSREVYNSDDVDMRVIGLVGKDIYIKEKNKVVKLGEDNALIKLGECDIINSLQMDGKGRINGVLEINKNNKIIKELIQF
ncbi:MAG: hypothetical protein SO022_10440 [Selenomonadaceae bacterium]|nr:hypothetical protein [Selenomonadaceae bacterium]